MGDREPEEKPGGQKDLSDLLADLLGTSRISGALDKVERLLVSAADTLERAPSATEGSESRGIAAGKGIAETLGLIAHAALENPEALAAQLSAFSAVLLKILRQDSDISPTASDRRFRDALWQESPFLRGLMQIYLAWGEHMQTWADEQEFGAIDCLRVKFLFDQFIAALSPSNLPINPAGLKRAENSGGMSAVAGIRNFVHDIRHNRGMPRQINPGAYRLGVDLATTPGAVVLRTPVLELIQYAPQTGTVRERALLLVPPQINKYYVFDLRPKNSLLGFLIREGFQVFTISWKNPNGAQREWGLDTYIRHTLSAIGAIRSITGMESVNLISACAGGLTATALTGYLAEAGAPLVHSHSLLVTALLPDSGSTLELFATPQSLELARAISKHDGAMDGMDLAHLFAWLRPNDLVWSYWVNNNILGRQPPPLDVLYWDNDPTRVPARLHSDFIDMFLDDVFQQPCRQSVLGFPIDFAKMAVDTYFVGGIDDYLMPWRGVYRVAKLLNGDHRFVLSTSGHVQSILRPPNLANTVHYVNPHLPDTADVWLEGAEKRQGSWWHDWSDWLSAKSARSRPAPERLGNGSFPPLADAPGAYVHERMEASA